jgi:hypothetical protein
MKMFKTLLLILLLLAVATVSAFAAKTTFSDGDPSLGVKGTRVTAAFLNSVNNHYCTGLAVDGDCALAYAADSGTTNTYVITLSPALTQYVVGMPIYFKTSNANTGASTLSINGLTATAIRKNVSTALAAGDILAGAIIEVRYDGTAFQLITSPQLFSGSLDQPYIKISEVQPSGTNGGSAVGSIYTKRLFNTKDNDTASIASLSSGQLTLPAGTYIFYARCPAYSTGFHRARLYNVTDSSTTILGATSTNVAPGYPQTDSVIKGLFVIAAQKTFEIQHITQSSRAGDGFGLYNNFGDNEVYAVAEFWKIK